MKTATDMKTIETYLHVVDKLAKANELNGLYKRFDNYDLSAECDMTLDGIATNDVDIKEMNPNSINKVLKLIHVNKATGPDGIFAFLREHVQMN